MRKMFAALAALIALSAFLGACGAKFELEGKWEAAEINARGETIPFDEYAEAEGRELSLVLEFMPDGVAAASVNGASLGGVYETRGERVTLTLAGEMQTLLIDGETLTMEQPGYVLVFKRAK